MEKDFFLIKRISRIPYLNPTNHSQKENKSIKVKLTQGLIQIIIIGFRNVITLK